MSPPDTPFITIVSGLPRSGTSLAMQMLHAGGLPALTDQQRTPDDDNPRGYFEFERVKHLATDQQWLDDASGKAVKIIHLLLTKLPGDRPCRVVFMNRNLAEVVRSQSAMLQRSGRAGGGLTTERLSAIYEEQLTTVRRWLSERPCFRVLDVNYHDLIRDPVAGAASINAFLGGTLNEQAMSEAVDPKLYRNREM